MAFTFGGKVAQTDTLEQLALVTEDIVIWNRFGRFDIVIKKASELMTQDINEIIAFIRNCGHRHLVYAVLRLYIEKYSVKDFAGADTLISLINIVQRFSEAGAKELIDQLFGKTPTFFVIPDDADAVTLSELLQNVSELARKMDHHHLLHNEAMREVDLFAHEIITRMAQEVMKGHPAKKFFEPMLIINFECDLIVAVAQMENVSVAILKQFFASSIFINAQFRSKNIVKSTLCCFFTALMQAAQRGVDMFSLDDVRMLAKNVIDPKGDGTSSAETEQFIIATAFPLLTAEEDIITVCRSFSTISGTHACIIAFLSSCTHLTNYQLHMLAECVHTLNFQGKEAMHQLQHAKEKFDLTADIERDLDFANRRFPSITSFIIEIAEA